MSWAEPFGSTERHGRRAQLLDLSLGTQLAELERQTVARELAASHRRGKGRGSDETAIRPPSSRADDVATDSEQRAPADL